jgi:hypothetical protein
MSVEVQAQLDLIGEMSVRRTTMPDGRYLIYFDFGEPAATPNIEHPDFMESDTTDV